MSLLCRMVLSLAGKVAAGWGGWGEGFAYVDVCCDIM